MALADDDRLMSGRLPAPGKPGVDLAIEFAGRVIGHIEQLDRLGGGERGRGGGKAQ